MLAKNFGSADAAVNTDGTVFTTLHNFTGGSDGAYPFAELILSGNRLYGTAMTGGTSGAGTVFGVNTDGTGFTNLYSFTALVSGTNGDGAYPNAELTLSGNALYGTANGGGSAGVGTVFRLSVDGSGFTNLHSFGAIGSGNINQDGANPCAGLMLLGETLYGTASSGGASGNGTVFAISADGTGYRNLHSFAAGNSVGPPSVANYTNSDGVHPDAKLILSHNTLYGTASGGGISGNGTVFSLSLPSLVIMLAETNAILTWSTDAPGFILQSAPAISGTFTNLPGATSPYTNPITGAQQFFRLISN